MWLSNKDIPLFVGVPVIMTNRVYVKNCEACIGGSKVFYGSKFVRTETQSVMQFKNYFEAFVFRKAV